MFGSTIPAMDVSELRKRILYALDEARRDASGGREVRDEAAFAWERFRDRLAVPLVRQAAVVLRAEGHLFSVATPADSVTLVSDRSPTTFLEFVLDTTRARPQVLGRVSVDRGDEGQLVEERHLAPDKPVAEIVENDLAAFLVTEIPKLVN